MDNGTIKRRRTFDEIELTAEDILEAIDEISNEERWKLLHELYYKYYNNSNLPRLEIDMEN
jgi:hypothetical protein